MVAQLCQLHADHGLQQGKVLPKWLVARNGKQAGGRRSCRMSAGSRTRFSTTKARCTAMMNTPPCKTRDLHNPLQGPDPALQTYLILLIFRVPEVACNS